MKFHYNVDFFFRLRKKKMYELQMRELREDVRNSSEYQDYLKLLSKYMLKVNQYKSKKASVTRLSPNDWDYVATRKTIIEESTDNNEKEKAKKEIEDFRKQYNKSINDMREDIEKIVGEIMQTSYVKRFYDGLEWQKEYQIKQSYFNF